MVFGGILRTGRAVDMHEARSDMRAQPFRSGPDPAAYVSAAPHEESLTALLQGLEADEPFVALTGEPGVGKSLIARLLLERIGDHAMTAVVTNCHLDSRSALFQALLYDLGLPFAGKSEQELRLTLTDFLLNQLTNGRRTIAVFDEAQHLSPDHLEELRLLTNLDAPRGRALQVVLIGLPELLETLERPELQALAQRLTTRAVLGRLDEAESVECIRGQLRKAGCDPDAAFDSEALELLTKAARGVPRILNQAARRAWSLARQAGEDRVEVEAALESLARLGIEAPGEDESASPAAEIDAIRLGLHHPQRAAAAR